MSLFSPCGHHHTQVSYKELCKVLFSRINPSLKDQVGNDRGTQYRHG
ncbi:MAG: peptide-methionine (S)-S-oxide reductase [Promethearchaeia archaeon]